MDAAPPVWSPAGQVPLKRLIQLGQGRWFAPQEGGSTAQTTTMGLQRPPKPAAARRATPKGGDSHLVSRTFQVTRIQVELLV